MTVPSGDFAFDNAAIFEEDNIEDIYPIDVRVIHPEGGGAIAPDFGGCSYYTVPVAGVGLPVQILQRRLLREQAWIRNNDSSNTVIFAENISKLQQTVPQGFVLGPGVEEKISAQQPYWAVVQNVTSGGGVATVSSQGIATSPVTAGEVVTSVTGLAPGVYSVMAVIDMGSTATSADANNTALYLNGVLISNLGNSQNNGVYYPTGPITVVVTQANSTLQMRIIGVGSGTANYLGTLYVTPQGSVTPAPVIVSVRDEAWAVNNDQSYYNRRTRTG